MNVSDDRKKTWRVEGVIPAQTKVPEGATRTWSKNINLQVVAVTMEECIDAVRAKYPDIKLVKVFTDRYLDDVIVAGE